jgi:hypothetical protein
MKSTAGDCAQEASMTNTPDSYIQTRDGAATSFVGPDAIRLFQAATLKSHIKLYAKSRIIPTRGVSFTKMLRMAADLQGLPPYKRFQNVQQAADKVCADLDAWMAAMKSALPIVEG